MILNRSKYLEMIDQLEKVVISVTDRMRNDPDRVYERERTIKECNSMIRKYKKRIELSHYSKSIQKPCNILGLLTKWKTKLIV